MKKDISTILLILVFVAGLSLLLYPSFSDYWNSLRQTHLISDYVESINNIDDNTYELMEQEAVEYNRILAKKTTSFLSLNEEEWVTYNRILNVSGTGIMGYVDIPSIRCSLPIYHGTDEGVLQIAVGHLEWSSLPVGGESTHAVLSGHRGLPSARLFTDIDQLIEGDLFYLNILGDTLTYEVDQILTVLPHDVDSLRVFEGKDYCTLVTCTPYGVNSHRLLVRGHRIETAEEAAQIRVTADALQIKPLVVAPVVAAPILLVLLICLFSVPSKKKRI